MKTGWSNSRQIWQNLLKKVIPQNGCLGHDDGDDYDDDDDDLFNKVQDHISFVLE
jgi:hypothetical protein